MPYVKQDVRQELEGLIWKLGETMHTFGFNGVGDCNYVITTLLQKVLAPETYTEYNAAIGVLECAKLELYRRAVAVYEDKKIRENGDVY